MTERVTKQSFKAVDGHTLICIPHRLLPPLPLEHITPPPTLPAIGNNKAACGAQK
jgi:adenylate kinase